MATIGLLPHPSRQEAGTLAAVTASWLIAEGHRAMVFGAVADVPDGSPSERLLASQLDLAVSLGGDGTMLRTVNLVTPFGVPVLGVNVGHLGFLTEVAPAELPQALKQFLAGDYRVEERMTLAVEVRHHDDRPARTMTALNDAVLQRTSAGHTVRLAVSVGGAPFLMYAADSVIVATPTGSTAYNLSARGPIVSPQNRILVMTPVAAHMLFDRSLVLAEGTDIGFEIIGDLPVELVVDGQSLGCLAAGDVVNCRTGAHDARFVDFGGRDFYRVLKQKFGLAGRLMLAELRVTDLGVIADLTVLLGPGMIAVTGETGTGKTLVVEAIELLLGGRADPVLVRPGATEVVVEGRFTGADDGDDVVVTRIVPASGRSRAYVNGRMAPLATLSEVAGPLVDLHGQHSHQSLLSGPSQRASLDSFAHVDLEPVADARRRIREAGELLKSFGGDAASRAREHDMAEFQRAEIEGAKLVDPDEDDRLSEEEERLAGAASHREAAVAAIAALAGDLGVTDSLGAVVARLSGHAPLEEIHRRLRAAAIDLADVTSDLRGLAESLEEDPERLAWIGQRRQLLRQLRRKYGDSIAAVIDYGEAIGNRLAELDSYDQRAGLLEAERDQAARDLLAAQEVVGRQRRAAAPRLAAAIEERLRTLAMPKARIEVHVGDDPAGEEVVWYLGANAGEPPLPLAKVASGGELARTMLAARLALGSAAAAGRGDEADPDDEAGRGDETGRAGTPTLVFDEVDAGIGGEAALAVGRALADLARHHQVLVVTHLPQVAAFADQQIAVSKEEVGGRTVATARGLDPGARVVELSRMLSGQPDSATARRHAKELLTLARRPAATA